MRLGMRGGVATDYRASGSEQRHLLAQRDGETLAFVGHHAPTQAMGLQDREHVGHAIEHAERYQWRHGAAISIGMVFAAELSRIVAHLDDEAVDRHRRILGQLGLPLTYPADRWKSLLATMNKDKKARGGVVRFVVLDGVGKPRVLAIPDESVLFAAYAELQQAHS